MTSDDLDLRKGHLGLRTMLRYVTDPNHVDSSATDAFITGILPRKGINWKCQTFCVWPDLWRHRWPRGQIFKLYLKDLVQAFPLPFEFFPYVCWIKFPVTSAGSPDPTRCWGGGGGATAPPPPAAGRVRTRPSRARVISQWAKNQLCYIYFGACVFEWNHIV